MNPALEGVDPFDPNLTAEQKAAVLNECRINPQYFLENCVRKSLVPREDWDDNQRFTDYVNTRTHNPATLEGELVDKGVEVKVYEDRIPLNDFLTQTLELRRERKKEIVANNNALEGEFEQGPPADMRKFFLPSGGIDVFALSAKAKRLAPKPALEGEFIKAHDPNAHSHKIEDFDPHSVNSLRHALQEIETAIEGEFIGKGERHISHIVEWTFCTEPGIAITQKGGGESCQANPKNKQISCEQPLTTKNLLIK